MGPLLSRAGLPLASPIASSSLHFSTSSATRSGVGSSKATAPAAHAPRILSAPSEPEEPDVYSAGPEPNILLTERASRQLSKVAQKEGPEKAQRIAFRIAVEPGGCHGYQYKMHLVEADEGAESPKEDDDFCFQPVPPTPSGTSSAVPSAKPIPVLIDSVSLHLLKGSTIDYVTELIGSQFAIKDNPQAKGAGCGCGVSWEPV
ncbi:unnamed protein product [Parajaminaea phylloscopi]